MDLHFVGKGHSLELNYDTTACRERWQRFWTNRISIGLTGNPGDKPGIRAAPTAFPGSN
jgi:hypothetical protein